MFKNALALGGLLVTVVGSTGCAFAPTGAPIGGIFASTMTNSAVTSNPVGAKTGEACAISILSVVTIGDASATTAAHQGGITKIGVVDAQDFNILGIYTSHCTEVKGD
jgi:hypothetical protein